MSTLADHFRCNELGQLVGAGSFTNEANAARHGDQTGSYFTGGGSSIGNLGTSLKGDTLSARMYVAPAVNYNHGSAFTVVYWLKFANFSSPFLGCGDWHTHNASGGNHISIDNASQITIKLRNDATLTFPLDAPLPTDEEVCIMVERETDSTWSVIINKVRQSTTVLNTGNFQLQYLISLNGYQNNNQADISDIQVWSGTTLTPQEIQTIYEEGYPPAPPSTRRKRKVRKMRQIKKGHALNITEDMGGVPDDTKTKLYSNGGTTQLTANLPKFQQHDATEVYSGSVIVWDYGVFTLCVYDSSDALLYSERFEVVHSYDREIALKCTNPNVTPYRHWPDKKVVQDTTHLQKPVGTTRNTFFQSGRSEFMTSGVCNLVHMRTGNAWTSGTFTDFRFSIVRWVNYTGDATGTYKYLGVSEQVDPTTDYQGNAVGNSQDVIFKLEKGLEYEAGDMLCITLELSGSTNVLCTLPLVTSPDFTDVHDIYLRHTAAPVAGQEESPNSINYAGEYVDFAPVIERPWFALAGHSVMGGAPNSTPIWAGLTGNSRFVAASCPGVMLSKRLGVPAISIAEGSSNISQQWTHSWGNIGNGTHERNYVWGIRPSVILFDTMINDLGLNHTNAEYVKWIKHLHAHCDQIGTRLAFVEPPPAEGVSDVNRATLERYTSVRRRYASLVGIPEIQTRNRMGFAEGNDEIWQRNGKLTNALYSGIPDYDSADGGGLHLSAAGNEALAQCCSDAILAGLAPIPSILGHAERQAEQEPPASIAGEMSMDSLIRASQEDTGEAASVPGSLAALSKAATDAVTVHDYTANGLLKLANHDTGLDPAAVQARSIADLSRSLVTVDNVTVGAMTQAALAQFMTDDTGVSEGAEHAQSVAKHSQAASVGNVTVGAMTQAALAQFMTDDTGVAEGAEHAQSVAKHSQAEAITGNVTVGAMTQAALAQFVSDDTGVAEGAEHAQSVAKHSQATIEAIGDVTVGALTQSALQQFVNDDTEVADAGPGSVAKLSQGEIGEAILKQVTFELNESR